NHERELGRHLSHLRQRETTAFPTQKGLRSGAFDGSVGDRDAPFFHSLTSPLLDRFATKVHSRLEQHNASDAPPHYPGVRKQVVGMGFVLVTLVLPAAFWWCAVRTEGIEFHWAVILFGVT